MRFKVKAKGRVGLGLGLGLKKRRNFRGNCFDFTLSKVRFNLMGQACCINDVSEFSPDIKDSMLFNWRIYVKQILHHRNDQEEVIERWNELEILSLQVY